MSRPPQRQTMEEHPFIGMGDAFAALMDVPRKLGELAHLVADMQTTPEKEVLTIREAAERYGLSETKLYELVARGEIHAIKIDRSTRVPVVEMRRWVAAKLAE